MYIWNVLEHFCEWQQTFAVMKAIGYLLLPDSPTVALLFEYVCDVPRSSSLSPATHHCIY